MGTRYSNSRGIGSDFLIDMVDIHPDADQIYEAYPRKIAKRAAIKAISLALGRIQTGESGHEMGRATAALFLRERTKSFAVSPAGNKGCYTPHPATWFNRSSYLDDPKEWEAPEKTYAQKNDDSINDFLRRRGTPGISRIV